MGKISMTDNDWSKVRDLVRETVKESLASEVAIAQAAVEAHSRGSDHLAWKSFMAREQRKAEIWMVVKKSTIGVITVGSLVWIGDHAVEIATLVIRLGGSKTP